jgi:hypothetical protein
VGVLALSAPRYNHKCPGVEKLPLPSLALLTVTTRLNLTSAGVLPTPTC